MAPRSLWPLIPANLVGLAVESAPGCQRTERAGRASDIRGDNAGPPHPGSPDRGSLDTELNGGAVVAVRACDVVTRNADDAVLGRAARRFRTLHTVIAVIDLAGLGYVWICAVTRRRDRLVGLSVSALLIEGVALVVGRGNCPLGPLQRKLGDPVPLFELVLPPRAAKAAVPVLAAISLVGLGLIVLRPPSAKRDR